MKAMTVKEAIREAMVMRMREDPNILLFGEDVGANNGTFGVSAGMYEEFGEKRVRDTPITESAIIGAATGAAATGLRPIAEIMMSDFLTVAMDQLANNAAKMRYMFGGKISLPMVVRTAGGGGRSAAAQHSQCLEAWVTHVPGLKVVYPSTPQDCLGLMLTAIDDNDPVVFCEHKVLYAKSGEVDSMDPIPLGKGDIKREGNDVTVIATGNMVYAALDAAEELEKDGISAEVLDPRSLFPLDTDLIAKSLSKTHRAVVVTEEVRRGGFGGEISAMIGETMFDQLDAPVVRIGALNTPVPFSPVLENEYLPNSQDIVLAVRKMM